MLHKHHGGPAVEDQFLNLDARENIDVVEGLVPEIEMGLLA